MLEKDKIALRDASPYNAAITREQFLFYEVRTTAKMVCEAVFLKAAEEAYDDERRDKILSTLLRFSLSEREMGWCLTGIEDAIDCFERLEKEKPYDSELSPHQT